MQWTDDLKIETPEQIDVALELAGLGSRFLARVIDWGAKWGTLVLVAAVAAILAALLGGSLAPVNRVAQILLITLGVGLLYAFLLISWTGSYNHIIAYLSSKILDESFCETRLYRFTAFGFSRVN